MIPKILYKTGKWEEKDLPKEIQNLFNKTLEDNTEYKIEYYSDARCREFIKNNFDQDVLTAFDSLKPGAYKADLFRYCILYKKGGVYGDLLHNYLVPLSEIVDNKKDNLVLVQDRYRLECKRSGIQISFMATVPYLLIYSVSITQIVNNVKNRFYGESPLHPTGPILFGDILHNIHKIKNYYLDYRISLFQDGDYHLSSIKTKKKLIKTKSKELSNLLYPDSKIPMNSKTYYDTLWSKRDIYNNI